MGITSMIEAKNSFAVGNFIVQLKMNKLLRINRITTRHLYVDLINPQGSTFYGCIANAKRTIRLATSTEIELRTVNNNENA